MDNLFGRIPIVGGLAQHLEGLEFPATKDDIVNFADEHDAPGWLTSVLDKIPDGVYDGLEELEQQIKDRI